VPECIQDGGPGGWFALTAREFSTLCAVLGMLCGVVALG